MTTIVRNTKIPQNFTAGRSDTLSRMNAHKIHRAKAAAKKNAADAVIPSTHGIRTIIPSTLDIADRARFGKYVGQMTKLVQGVDAIIKIRQSDEAMADPELAALANDPRIAKAFNKAIERFRDHMALLCNSGTNDSLLRDYNANSTDDPVAIAEGRITGQDSPYGAAMSEELEHLRAAGEATRTRTDKIERAAETAFEVMQREMAKGKTIEEARVAAREAVLSQHGEAAKAAGLDAGWQAFDAATIALREKAARRASELRHAANAVNPARVALGLADDADLDPIGTMQKLFGK